MSELTVARQFATWGATLPYADVPDSVTICAQRAVLDTVGVIVAGSIHPKVVGLGNSIVVLPGKCSAATGQRTDAVAAATVNGMAGHVWDYDDTSYTGIMHGSTIILPTVIAVAQETGATEEEAMLAFIIGSELAYCLGEICTHSHYLAGWWPSGSCSLIGAVAAACRLYALDVDQTTNAIGTAAVTAGIQRAFFGTDTKPYLCGSIAAQAITLARAAQAGITGPHNAFEQPNGFFKLLNKGQSELSLASSLGQKWRLETPGLLFKTSPVCSAAHAVIELTAQLLKEAGKSSDDIASADAEVPEMVRVGLVFDLPENAQQAQFSLPYCFACAAEHGRVRLNDLSQAAIVSPTKRVLMDCISISTAKDLSTSPMCDQYPESTRLTITFKDGQATSGFCGEVLGMPNRPLSDEALTAKFSGNLAYAKTGATSADFDPSIMMASIRKIFEAKN